MDPHPLAVYHELAVKFMNGAQVLDEKHVRFAVPIKGPGWDDFSFVMWHHPTEEWIGRCVSRELSGKYLVDSLNCAAWQTPERIEDVLWAVAADGLWSTPYVGHCANDWGGKSLVRAPCLSAPAYITETTNRMREIGRRIRKFCPAGYDLGDENRLVHDTTDVCFSPDCQASFRVYLKERYASLAALNAEWGTSFKDWTEVSPIVKADAVASNQVPRWVDHRMHMNSVFADTHRRWRDAIRESDVHARVGFEGPVGEAGYNGYDLWKLSRFMDFWGAYPYAADWYEAARSFAPKGHYAGVWFGGYPDTRYWFHNWPWTAVLSQMSSVWWWPAFGDNASDAIAPDLRPYPDFVATVEQDIRPLKSGLGKLIMHAQPEAEPVAVHYSMESLYARLATGLPGSTLSYKGMIEGAGLSFRIVAPEQIIAGELNRVRVFVLPGSLALADAEAKAIRAFVEAGGIVVADVRPGVTDEHGKPRAAGALDDLLNLGSAQPEASPHRDGTTVGRGVPAEPGTSSGRALFSGRDVGKGKTLLMVEGAATNAGLAKAFGEWVRPVGLVPPVTVTDATGTTVATPTLYREGDAMLVAFSGGAQKFTWGRVSVQLPAPRWCYLASEGVCLGYTNRPVVEVSETMRYRTLVGLPYKVEGLTAAHRRGDAERAHTLRLAIEAKGGKAGYHVIRVSVTGPDGIDRPWYAANVAAVGGRAEHIVPLALNDPHGEWMVTARDVVSGASTRVMWKD